MTPDSLALLAAVLGLSTDVTGHPAPPPEPPPTTPADDDLVPLVRAKGETDPTLDDLKEGSEVEADPPPKRGRVRTAVAAVGRFIGEAAYKAVVLLLAVALLAAAKAGLCACGLSPR
jgi:hypothetical protein